MGRVRRKIPSWLGTSCCYYNDTTVVYIAFNNNIITSLLYCWERNHTLLFLMFYVLTTTDYIVLYIHSTAMNEKNMEQKILQDRCHHHPSVDQQILDYVVPYLFWLESTAVFQADSSRSVHCCRKFSFYCFFCWLPFIFISLKVSHQKLERKWPVSQPKPKQIF